MNYKVIDFETTSLRTKEKIEFGQVVEYPAQIIEIGITEINDGKIGKNYSKFIKPTISLPSVIVNLTHITDDMLKNSKSIEEVLPALRKYLGDDTLIAHNANYDITLINYYLNKLGLPLIKNYICTLQLLKQTPSYGGENKKLGTACEYYGIKNIAAHRAYADTYATAQLFLKLTDATLLM